MLNRYFVIGLAGVGLGLLGLSLIEREPKLLYNPSPSAPIGWYKISPKDTYSVGDLVAAWLPENAENLAVRRGYLAEGIPVIKTVAAVHGDQYCIENDTLRIGSGPPLTFLSTDSQGREMPVLSGGCRRVSAGNVLLISRRINLSFDSRYFGEVAAAGIIGRADLIGGVEVYYPPESSVTGGARGMGADGKIKGHGANPTLSPCLHINFYGAKAHFLVPRIAVNCRNDWGFDGTKSRYVTIDQRLNIP